MSLTSRRSQVVVLLLSLLVVAGAAAFAVPIGTSASADVRPPLYAAPPQEPATPSTRPNIVVFMADDMRYDDLTFMPQTRRLVGDTGLRFENAFSPYPLCCPARASFLTGRAAHNHKVYWHEAPFGFGAFDDSFTIATALRRSGYNTGFLGKYLNGYGVQRSKVTGGPSERYVPRGWTDWRAAVERPAGASWYGSPYHFFNTAYNINGQIDAGHEGEYQTNTLGRMTRAMTTRFHKSNAPFFVFASYVAPHHGAPEPGDPPLWVPRSDGKLVEFATTGRPEWVRGRFDHVIRKAAGVPVGGGPVERDVRDKPRGLFRAPEMTLRERVALREVTRQRAEALFVLDQEVGRTVAHLKKIGEWRNTVFVFTSDNGYYLGEHRKRVGKVTAHEPALRVPLLMTGPGVPAGRRRYDPVTTMDLTATIASLGGAAGRFPFALDGESAVPVIRHGDRGWTRPVLTEALYGSTDGTKHTWRVAGYPEFRDPRGSIGLRLGRYKITVYATGFVELYDLARDPNEQQGVQRDPAYRAVKRQMLRQWWRYKDCRGADCVATLPSGLRSSAAQERSVTTHMIAERIRRYGR